MIGSAAAPRRMLWLASALVAASVTGASGCSPSAELPQGSGGGSSVGGAGGSAAPGETGGAPAASGGASTDSGGAPGNGGGAGAGGQGAGGSAGGSGGANGLVQPIERSASSYVLEFGDYLLEVDPTQGARIVTFSYQGTNVLWPVALTTSDPVWLNGGSTLWPSPQAIWNWPPIDEIDRDPYVASAVGSAIRVVGSPATISQNSTSIHVEKSLSADVAGGAFDLTYEIHNDGDQPATYAAWEVSRHARGGFTFWPGAEAGGGARWEFPPESIDGIYYWDDAITARADQKVSSDGEEGWVAHIEGDLLLLKTWPAVPAGELAPAQGEVELYLGTENVEVEVQGPYVTIPAHGHSSFTVRWLLRQVPEGLDVSPGSSELLAFVRSLVP